LYHITNIEKRKERKSKQKERKEKPYQEKKIIIIPDPSAFHLY
tara:strand:- start:1709 stop:1837 length:129 start_codon:yes stop_codon:yes gene_type:complete